MRPDKSLSRRIVTIAALSVGLVMLAAALAAAGLLKTHLERGFDQRLRHDAQLLLAGLSHDANRTLVIDALPENADYERLASGWYWQVRENAETVARSRSLLTHVLREAAAGGPCAVPGAEGEPLRCVSVERTPAASLRPLIVTVAGPQAEVDRAVLSELLPLLAGLAALGLVLIGVLWWQVNRSLAPLNDLVRDIERLAGGNISALPPGRYRELSRLTTTINDLLGQSRTLVLGYRDRAAKLAHALKTPLALIAARADREGPGPDNKVLGAVAAMQRQIDHNLKRARAGSASAAFAQRVPVRDVAAELMFAIGHLYRARGLSPTVSIAEDVSFLGDREDLEEMLGNLIENAHKWARSRVEVDAVSSDGALRITIEDDGSGFADAEVICRPDQGDRPSNAGLGLVITREIAAAHGGELHLGRSACGGARVVLQFSRRPG